MRNVQCPGCKKTLRVPDAETEKSIKCPVCGKQLRIPPAKNIGGEKIVARSWSLRDNDGTVYGLYTFEEISAFISEQRLIATTEVKHPEATKGEWILAARVVSIAALLATAPVDVLAPPVATAEKTTDMREVEPETFEVFAEVKQFQQAVHTRSPSWQFLIDFFDPTFQRYVTPTVVMITWWIVLAFTAITLVLAIISLIIYAVPGAEDVVEQQANFRERPRIAPRLPSPPEFVRKLISAPVLMAIQIIGACLTLLWVRVVLEICVVVFHIARSLKTIQSSILKHAGLESD